MKLSAKLKDYQLLVGEMARPEILPNPPQRCLADRVGVHKGVQAVGYSRLVVEQDFAGVRIKILEQAATLSR